MLCCISTVVFGLAFLYGLYTLLKRKIAKPDFTGKTVWITGAASGLGEQMAYEFNRVGAHVIISDLRDEGLKKVQQSSSAPERVECVRMDMSNFAEIETKTAEVLKKLEKQGKKVDVVVQNAGISQRSLFVDFSFQNHLKLFDVNINGPIRHLQFIVPHMIKNKSGHVVGVSSTAAKLGGPLRSSYSASKHAFVGFMDSLRSQVSRQGLYVTNLMPGYVKTKVCENAMAGAPGQTFGKTDPNIGTGMDPADFAHQAVIEVYLRSTQVSVATNWYLIQLIIMLRAILPNVIFRWLKNETEKQLKGLDEAKKDE